MDGEGGVVVWRKDGMANAPFRGWERKGKGKEEEGKRPREFETPMKGRERISHF
jgi:hypothetical protein